MKKLLFSLLILLLIVTGCSSKTEYDSEYGVMYAKDDLNFIRINVNPDDSETILKLWIVSQKPLGDNNENMTVYPTIGDNENNKIEYSKTDMQESVQIRFYSGISDDDLKTVNEYLGTNLSEKTSLYDLIESSGLSFSYILEEGTLIKDISFTGNKPFKWKDEQ